MLTVVIIKIKKTESNQDIGIPKYQTEGSAAFDLHAAIKEDIILKTGERALIPAGFTMEMPKGFYSDITPRSGLAARNGISIVNSPAVIDSDYRGEIKIVLINLGKEDFQIKRNDRIAQMKILRYEHAELVEVNELSETKRGTGSFGSTGKQ